MIDLNDLVRKLVSNYAGKRKILQLINDPMYPATELDISLGSELVI